MVHSSAFEDREVWSVCCLGPLALGPTQRRLVSPVMLSMWAAHSAPSYIPHNPTPTPKSAPDSGRAWEPKGAWWCHLTHQESKSRQNRIFMEKFLKIKKISKSVAFLGPSCCWRTRFWDLVWHFLRVPRVSVEREQSAWGSGKSIWIVKRLPRPAVDLHCSVLSNKAVFYPSFLFPSLSLPSKSWFLSFFLPSFFFFPE